VKNRTKIALISPKHMFSVLLFIRVVLQMKGTYRCLKKGVILFEHPKVDNFWDDLFFLFSNKKKRVEERE
jgi:hypothetical protein